MILVNVILLLCRFSIEDYRVILVDSKLDDAAGHRVNICTLNMRRLIEDKPLVIVRFNDKARELIVSHKINRKLNALEDE